MDRIKAVAAQGAVYENFPKGSERYELRVCGKNIGLDAEIPKVPRVL
jgi:hypothetical protein